MKKIAWLLTIPLVWCSCAKWNDYIGDFDYSTVYFANQDQLRTVVANEGMGFEMGVALGGKRQNNTREWARFEIDNSLLEQTAFVGNYRFTPMPPQWYTLSDPNTMWIEQGSMLGTVRVTFDRNLFTSDPATVGVKYALAVRITGSSADSVLRGEFKDGVYLNPPKDYAIIVVKYINPVHGNYYLRGRQYVWSDGAYVLGTEYWNGDLSRNKAVALTTADLTHSTTTYMGALSSSETFKVGLKIALGADNAVTIDRSDAAVSVTSFTAGACSYDPGTRIFTLRYDFETVNGSYRIEEELVWRDTRITFEQWGSTPDNEEEEGGEGDGTDGGEG